ncbi:MAG: beta-N-acetylhexosaminidase [Sphaerochaetaceae bacterium]|nr:beta-N-acetylhexosaminidase [Sphaerochaetaceae bacterium]MDD3163532.1 beta-N-acetylhexosaminidase [Sphaerochaetaceae bacterium]MDD4007792.1 beta-N-acetylhexosaminidase [Sphaerochaetaceae bacterium]MDD4396186.1 beta-N-acetylhexosaminidase [Sphaerochaetaceae bacterium]
MVPDRRIVALGQRFCVGIPCPYLDSGTADMLRKYKIGNVILFKRNIQNREQVRSLCHEVRELIASETGIEPFIMIDEEGGEVSRLSQDFASVPGAMAIRATDDPENARMCGQIVGKELASVGINMDLAPVLDVNSNPNNPVIGVRSYGEDPETVARYGLQMARGLADFGVFSCAKHFPGHGDTSIDSHIGLPIIDKTLSELEKLEIIPFRSAVLDGIPAIMTSHIVFPKIDATGVPATMSRRILVDLLRNRMRYDGLIITDCMEMSAISQHFGIVGSTMQALGNGADIALISHHAGLAAQAIDQMEASGLDEKSLMESYGRILGAKVRCFTRSVQSSGANDDDRNVAEAIGQSTVTECSIPESGKVALGSNPLFVGCRPFSASPVSDGPESGFSFAQSMQSSFGGDCIVISDNPDLQEIRSVASKVKGHSCIVFGTCCAHSHRGQIDLGSVLEKQGIPMIVTALLSPYDLAFFSGKVQKLAIYEYSTRSMRWLASYFCDMCEKTGKQFFSLEAQDI